MNNFLAFMILTPYILLVLFMMYHVISMHRLKIYYMKKPFTTLTEGDTCGYIKSEIDWHNTEQYPIKPPPPPQPRYLREGEQPPPLKKPTPPYPRILKEDRKPRKEDYTI